MAIVSVRPDSKAENKEDQVTKQEFVAQVSDESGLGRKEAGEAVDAVLKVIEETLARGGEINFTRGVSWKDGPRGRPRDISPEFWD